MRCTIRRAVGAGVLLVGVSAGVATAVVARARTGTAMPRLIRSARSGPWSAASTWAGGHVPAAGARVQVRAGDRVVYDLNSDQAIRSIHVAGTLAFAMDGDTRLDVGLIKIQPGENASENGFDCDAHMMSAGATAPRPALEVGTPSRPIPPAHTALIRLVYFAGMDRDSCPAIVCCGGRMDFHGAPMRRTWVKLGATAQAGDRVVTLAEPVGAGAAGGGWRVGDHLIITATQRFPTGSTNGTFRPGFGSEREPGRGPAAPASDAARAVLEARDADLACEIATKFAVGPARGMALGATPAGEDAAMSTLVGARVALWTVERAKRLHAPGKDAAVTGVMAARRALSAAEAATSSRGAASPAAEPAIAAARTALSAAEAALARDAPDGEATDAAIAAARAATAAAAAVKIGSAPAQEAAQEAALMQVVANARQKHTLPAYTEERSIAAIDGAVLTLDRPLEHRHLGTGEYRGEVADLSRNVIVESADPHGVRGHTMYHRGSAGSISYAEFRHLGKEGVLGRYSLHFHLTGDTMRGSSVIGASIWDSANRWLTVHGTNYLVVRDCVGYQSVGHGFYVEDGSEEDNVFDHNLAVQAYQASPLPKQNLPFDTNDGAGFWWANSLNTFTRNVACECDGYGYRFEATPTDGFDLRRPVRQPDGSVRPIDIRTLPFVRFEENEAHSILYGINFGEGTDSVGPDARHPFVLRNTKLWDAQWAFRPDASSMIVDGMQIFGSRYGIFQPVYDHQAYSRLAISRTEVPGGEPFILIGQKPEGLAFPDEGLRARLLSGSGKNQSPDFKAAAEKRSAVEAYVSGKLAAGKEPGPGGVGAGTVVSARDAGRKFAENAGDPLLDQPSGLPDVVLTSTAFPRPLTPVDDLPPATVITFVEKKADGNLMVRGTTSDNGAVKHVLVNGREARATAPNFAEWEITLPGAGKLTAFAEDEAGNVEKTPHVTAVSRVME